MLTIRVESNIEASQQVQQFRPNCLRAILYLMYRGLRYQKLELNASKKSKKFVYLLDVVPNKDPATSARLFFFYSLPRDVSSEKFPKGLNLHHQQQQHATERVITGITMKG